MPLNYFQELHRLINDSQPPTSLPWTSAVLTLQAFINYCIGQKQLDSHTGLIVKSSTGNANVILQLDSAKSKVARLAF